MRRLRNALGAALFAAALATAAGERTARAEGATFSAYELSVIGAELARLKAEIEPEPEGKVVSHVETVRLGVFDESDPWPDFFNVFHVTTLERVIRRELLFEEGAAWSAERADETARNLRQLRQLSLVLIVPYKDAAPGRVRVLVVTKDVWSLRLNSDVQYDGELNLSLLVPPSEKNAFLYHTAAASHYALRTSAHSFDFDSTDFEFIDGDLNYLLLNPTEENVFGTHASVGGLFVLRPSTYSTGLVLSHSRVAGSRLAGSASGNVVWNRDSDEAEGSFGSFAYGLPLYSAEQRWAFETVVRWSDLVARVIKSTGDGSVELSYRAERYVGGTEVVRSFGLTRKVDVAGGVEADRRSYRPRIPAGTDPELARDFVEDDVPFSDTRISPYVQLRTYQNRFLKTIELETLGLQEDFRLGPTTLIRVYPASREVGSSRDLLGVHTGVGYTAALGDGLARAVLTSTLEIAAEQRHDAIARAALRVATPRLGLGRVIFDGVLANRYFDYLRRDFAIGGADRLRGYPLGSAEFAGGERQRGNDALVLNTEFRSTSVDVLSAQCGLALFHDAGDAADTLSALSLQHSIGAGLRILFPQFNRIAFRLDWGFPVSSEYSFFPGAVFFTYGQAFLMPELAPPSSASAFVD